MHINAFENTISTRITNKITEYEKIFAYSNLLTKVEIRNATKTIACP
jgi:hypothetical protein